MIFFSSKIELWGGMAEKTAGVVRVGWAEWVLEGSAAGCGVKMGLVRVTEKRAGWSLGSSDGVIAWPV